MIFYYLTRDSAKKKKIGSSRALDSWSGREEKVTGKIGNSEGLLAERLTNPCWSRFFPGDFFVPSRLTAPGSSGMDNNETGWKLHKLALLEN